MIRKKKKWSKIAIRTNNTTNKMTIRVTSNHQKGCLIIQIDSRVYEITAPIALHEMLEEPVGFYTDAMTASSAKVPVLQGFLQEFRTELRKLEVPASNLTKIFDYTASNLLFGKFDGDNPGHLFVAIQCFAGAWAGIAAQSFALALVRRCQSAAATREMNPLHVVIAVLAAICKCFGSSLRIAPLLPRWPEGPGTPPDPVVLLADAIIALYPVDVPISRRVELIDAIRVWHVPKSVRASQTDWKVIWAPHRQYDRARGMVKMQLNTLKETQ